MRTFPAHPFLTSYDFLSWKGGKERPDQNQPRPGLARPASLSVFPPPPSGLEVTLPLGAELKGRVCGTKYEGGQQIAGSQVPRFSSRHTLDT